MKEKLEVIAKALNITILEESVEEQEQNCEMKKDSTGRLSTKIAFPKNKNWTMCRLSFSAMKSYILQSSYMGNKPYVLMTCKFTNSSFQTSEKSFDHNIQRKCSFTA